MMAAFNAINENYYNGELEKPVITFKEGKKKKAYGWIETRKQWVQGKNERYEINISSVMRVILRHHRTNPIDWKM